MCVVGVVFGGELMFCVVEIVWVIWVCMGGVVVDLFEFG